MKFIIAFVALLTVALAAPPAHEVQVLSADSDVRPDGFNYRYETSDGTAAQAAGHVINQGSEYEGIAVQGSYQYVGDDGQTYQVHYIADENGFQPQGAHLPVAPLA